MVHSKKSANLLCVLCLVGLSFACSDDPVPPRIDAIPPDYQRTLAVADEATSQGRPEDSLALLRPLEKQEPMLPGLREAMDRANAALRVRQREANHAADAREIEQLQQQAEAAKNRRDLVAAYQAERGGPDAPWKGDEQAIALNVCMELVANQMSFSDVSVVDQKFEYFEWTTILKTGSFRIECGLRVHGQLHVRSTAPKFLNLATGDLFHHMPTEVGPRVWLQYVDIDSGAVSQLKALGQ